MNSVIISLAVTAACILAGAFAGYALSRFKGRLFSFYKLLLYMLQMLPLVLLLIPLFMMMRFAKLYDTLYSVMISYTAINLPICIWMLKGFFDTIPYSIEESALMDGASYFRIYRSIILPLLKPACTTLLIINGIGCYNDFYIPNLYLRKDVQTFTVALYKFFGNTATPFEIVAAAILMGIIPIGIVFLFLQRYIFYGLSGAIKS
jgi:multiple sugar transport system permease protein